VLVYTPLRTASNLKDIHLLVALLCRHDKRRAHAPYSTTRNPNTPITTCRSSLVPTIRVILANMYIRQKVVAHELARVCTSRLSTGHTHAAFSSPCGRQVDGRVAVQSVAAQYKFLQIWSRLLLMKELLRHG